MRDVLIDTNLQVADSYSFSMQYAFVRVKDPNVRIVATDERYTHTYVEFP